MQKLSLNRETLGALTPAAAGAVQAGTGYTIQFTQCPNCATFYCGTMICGGGTGSGPTYPACAQ